jgi:hypothetical protein
MTRSLDQQLIFEQLSEKGCSLSHMRPPNATKKLTGVVLDSQVPSQRGEERAITSVPTQFLLRPAGAVNRAIKAKRSIG